MAHNDICRWLNDNYVTVWVIIPRLKEYFYRNCEVIVKNTDDLNEIEIKLLNESFKPIILNYLQDKYLDDSICRIVYGIYIYYI